MLQYMDGIAKAQNKKLVIKKGINLPDDIQAG
jgi:hypothetical protein